MKSKDIYNLTSRPIYWEDDWIYIGIEDQFNKTLFNKLLQSHFEDKTNLFLRKGRQNSVELDLTTLTLLVSELIGKENFEIWNKEFDKAIKTNKIGVVLKSKNTL